MFRQAIYLSIDSSIYLSISISIQFSSTLLIPQGNWLIIHLSIDESSSFHLSGYIYLYIDIYTHTSSIHLNTYIKIIFLHISSIHPSIPLSIDATIFLATDLFIYISIHPSMYSSIYYLGGGFIMYDLNGKRRSAL